MKYPSKRYHSDIYFPDNVNELVLEFISTFSDEIDVTAHGAEQLLEDKRGIIPLPTKSELLNLENKLIEYHERINKPNRIQKAIIRIENLSENFDYCYVVARGGVIVTAWTNDKGDKHRLTHSKNIYEKKVT